MCLKKLDPFLACPSACSLFPCKSEKLSDNLKKFLVFVIDDLDSYIKLKLRT